MTESLQSDDRLIEVCLEEVIGGASPPDLAERILTRFAAPSNDPPVADLVATEPEPPPVVHQPADETVCHVTPKVTDDSRQRQPWMMVVAAACVLITGSLIGFVAARWNQPQETNTADAKTDNEAEQVNNQKKDAPVAKQAIVVSPNARNKVVEPPRQQKSSSTQIANSNQGKKQATAVVPEAVKTRDDAEVVALVNTALQKSWQQHQVLPAERASASKWCRRIYVRLVGRIPDTSEIEAFVKADTPLEYRKEALVRNLQKTDEYARHWANYWTKVLLGRLGGTSRTELANRDGLKAFLYQSLRKKHSYAKIANDLLTATGSNRVGEKDFNGATNFLLAGLKKNNVVATSRTSRVFLGKQLNCVRCHNHPANSWDQHHFWSLNAFFRQMRVEQDKVGIVRLIDRDADKHVFFEYPNGQLKVAFPSFPESQPVSSSGQLADVNLRQELAQRIKNSKDFSLALVNRLWGHFFGYGFTRPIDDMGPHNAPASGHRGLLNELAAEFAGSGHKLDRAIRWMVLSDAFALSSRVPENSADNPLVGGVPLFTHYYARQMDPEDVYKSLMVAAKAYKSGNYRSLEKAQRAWLAQFHRRAHGEENGNKQGNVRELFIMMTGPLMKRLTEVRPGSVLHLVKASKMSADKKIEHLFLSALARKPRAKEARAAKQMMEKNPKTALQDIWWALLNSTEFVLDH